MNSPASGFIDPALDSARAFRIAMQAMARPGTIHCLSGPMPDGLGAAAAMLLLTLSDRTTPVRLCGSAMRACDWLTFHTGAPAADPGTAVFAVGPWHALDPIADYASGTPDYPDRSTTLVVELERLTNEGSSLAGPGIERRIRLSLPDSAILARNAILYPQGNDFYFTCGSRLAALPRSTQLKEDG